MRVVQPAAAAVLVAAVTQVCALACSHHSFSDFPSDGLDAAGDDSPASSSEGVGSAGDDAEATDALDLADSSPGSSTGPPGAACAVPDGTYTVTATPSSDSGAGCIASTATITFPPPPPSDAGASCLYASSGSLPVCAVTFSCIDDDGTQTTNTSGFIEVIASSFAGAETQVVTADADASEPLSTCTFDLTYAAQ
jgi:hypothetical protein